jgi:hypothetical protein
MLHGLLLNREFRASDMSGQRLRRFTYTACRTSKRWIPFGYSICVWSALAVFLAVTLWSPGVQAQKHPTLVRARREYVNQNYKQVIALVKPLVEPRSVLASEDEEAEAYELLGLSYWWLKKYKSAEAAFLILLSMRPGKKLDAAVHARGVIKFFNRVRKKVQRKSVELKTRHKEELKICRRSLKSCRRQNKTLKKQSMVKTVVKRPLWLAFLPFGVGQFNNGDTTLGWVFFSTETALLLANLTTYILASTRFVRNGENNLVKNDDASIRRAQNVQISQITTGVLLLSVAAAGIIEALVSYTPTTVKTRPLFKDTKKKRTTRMSPRVSPFFGPGGGGLNVQMDF